MTRPVLLGYTMYGERKPLVTVGFPYGLYLEIVTVRVAAGRLLLIIIVVFTMAVSVELEQHAKDTARRANAAAEICNRQCHTPSPPFFRGTGEVSPKDEGTTAKASTFARLQYSLGTMYHNSTNFARAFC